MWIKEELGPVRHRRASLYGAVHSSPVHGDVEHTFEPKECGTQPLDVLQWTTHTDPSQLPMKSGHPHAAWSTH